MGADKAEFLHKGDDDKTSNNINVEHKDNNITTEYTTIKTISELEGFIKKAKNIGKVAFDIETNSLDAMTAELVGFSLSYEAGKACYVPLSHKIITKTQAKQTDLFDEPTKNDGEETVTLDDSQIAMSDALQVLKPFLEDNSVLKIGAEYQI